MYSVIESNNDDGVLVIETQWEPTPVRAESSPEAAACARLYERVQQCIYCDEEAIIEISEGAVCPKHLETTHSWLTVL
jgi:hypothetical protein